MHQQAILVTGNANLGSVGTLVGIDKIEQHYATTIAANAGINYMCANPKCGVPVVAVITKLTKKTRKNSPSSYFRANKSKPHVNGCSRAPAPLVPTAPAQGGTVGPASPNRTNAPAVWVDPLSHTGGLVSGGSGGNASGTPSSGLRGTRGTSGSGTSQGQSQMVESFAKKWLAMNAQTQRSSPLAASWNPQGTYHTAFHPFGYTYNATIDASTSGQKIYVGVLKQVLNSASGYIITFLEKNSGGEALEVFVPPEVFLFGPPGSALNSKLGSLVGSTKPSQVFALGTFLRSRTGALSLSVAHPHYIYIP